MVAVIQMAMNTELRIFGIANQLISQLSNLSLVGRSKGLILMVKLALIAMFIR